MPTYEYECQDCGIHFDRRQRITEDPLKTCPECGGEVQRVIHPVGIVFKGSGWYVTDHRRPQPVSDSMPSINKTDSATKTDKTESSTESTAPTASTSDSE